MFLRYASKVFPMFSENFFYISDKDIWRFIHTENEAYVFKESVRYLPHYHLGCSKHPELVGVSIMNPVHEINIATVMSFPI